MPDVYRYSVDNLPPLIKEAMSLGIRSIILFGIPEKKTKWDQAPWIRTVPSRQLSGC